MADTKSVFREGSRVSIYKFRPEDIVIKAENNGRHDTPNVDWLIQDIVSVGQLEPVLVRKDGDKPVLVAGFSRWRAIVEINKRKLTPEPLPILASYFRGNEVEGFKANIRENRFRNSTTDLDDSHNVVRLLSYEIPYESIAALYFPQAGDDGAMKKAVAWVKRRAKLATLTPEAEAAVQRGDIKPTAAVHIAQLAAEVQKDLVKKGRVTASDIRKAEGKKLKMTSAEIKTEINMVTRTGKLDTGFKVPDQVINWLDDLLSRM